MTATERMVRMGEHAVSRSSGDVLASIGLGSCIGLAILDTAGPAVGLAHVMLPEAPAGRDSSPAKYADLAVPALVAGLVELGASRNRLAAVLVGGAQMFAFAGAGRMDVGSRNDRATRAALEEAGIPIVAAATSGSQGRTIRVLVEGPRVLVKEAGGETQDLFAPALGMVA